MLAWLMKTPLVIKQLEKWSHGYLEMDCSGGKCYGVLAVRLSDLRACLACLMITLCRFIGYVSPSHFSTSSLELSLLASKIRKTSELPSRTAGGARKSFCGSSLWSYRSSSLTVFSCSGATISHSLEQRYSSYLVLSCLLTSLIPGQKPVWTTGRTPIQAYGNGS